MGRKSSLPSNIEELVTSEILGSYSHEEILSFKSFNEFWDSVEALNAFEEEWGD